MPPLVARTDAQGAFTVTAPGFAPGSHQVKLDPGAVEQVNLVLRRAPTGTRTTVRHDGAERRPGCSSAVDSMQPCCPRDEGWPLGAGWQGRRQTTGSCSGKEPGW